MAKAHTGRERGDKLIRLDGELPVRENRYYKKISERYRTAGFLLILVFVLFLGVMLVKFGEYITYDNFVYLMRDFDSMRGTSGVSDIEYPSAESGTFASFKGGIAVHSEGVFTLYDSTGVELVSKNESMSSPAMAVGEEYILLYDIGGRSYSLYNSLTRVMTHQAEGNIISASVSDSGAFSLTYESNEARYVTEVYGKALTRTMSIYKDKYVISAAVSDDGEYVAIASVSEDAAGYGYELSFYKTGVRDAVRTVTAGMTFPLALRGMKDGNFVLICDDSVRFYSSSGEEISSVSAGGLSLINFNVSRQNAVVVCRADGLGAESRVYSFDSSGNVIYNSTVSMKAVGAAASYDISDGSAGYVTDGKSVLKLYSSGTEPESADTESEILKITDSERGFIACTADVAVRLFSGRE